MSARTQTRPRATTSDRRIVKEGSLKRALVFPGVSKLRLSRDCFVAVGGKMLMVFQDKSQYEQFLRIDVKDTRKIQDYYQLRANLIHCKVMRCEDPKEFVVHVSDFNRSHYFITDSEEEAKEWIEAITQAIKWAKSRKDALDNANKSHQENV